jgi:hypothetical protein
MKENAHFSSFDRIPTEILHMILVYYTNTLKGLLIFSAINRSCQSICRSSLLWLSCDLIFHAPFALSSCLDLSREEFENILQLPYSRRSHVKILFAEEKHFPLVCKVIISREIPSTYQSDPRFQACFAEIYQDKNETAHHYAERISSYVLELNRQFQHYWGLEIQYNRFIKGMRSVYRLNAKIHSYFPGFLLLIIALISISMYFLNDVDYGDLTDNNRIGLQLALVAYLLLFLLLINFSLKDSLSWTEDTRRNCLKLQFSIDPRVGALFGLCLIGLAILILLILSYACLTGMMAIPSWVIVLIFWVFLLPVPYLLTSWTTYTLNNSLLTMVKIVSWYVLLILPMSPLLLALYCDDDKERYHGIPSLGYAVVPWYPMAMVLLLLTVVFMRFWLERIYRYLKGRGDLGARGRLFPEDTPQWVLNIWGFFYILMFQGSLIVASLAMIMLSVTSFLEEAMEIGAVSLTGTFLVLLTWESLAVCGLALYFHSTIKQ